MFQRHVINLRTRLLSNLRLLHKICFAYKAPHIFPMGGSGKFTDHTRPRVLAVVNRFELNAYIHMS